MAYAVDWLIDYKLPVHVKDVVVVDVQKICENLNYRHRMAQYAGRASVALHTQVLTYLQIQVRTLCSVHCFRLWDFLVVLDVCEIQESCTSDATASKSQFIR